MKYPRYRGDFLSIAGVRWSVEILQEAEKEFPVEELTFEADEPLLIEWYHTEKEDVIGGSTATLKIESPGDRTYEDLFTIKPGQIRMDVYREGVLYWSGTLDPEFYEEPYERLNLYPVSLTFSDFGILDRLKYDLSGMKTIREIIEYCLSKSMINEGISIDDSLISTSVDGVSPMQLNDLKVLSDNFYDEDGEALSLKEVLEGVLQPLALRVIQRFGKIYVYDLNALYHDGLEELVKWDGASQTMGTDKVYNNARITWSPYAKSGALNAKECWTEDIDNKVTALNCPDGKDVENSTVFSYFYSNESFDMRYDATNIGFSLWVSKKGKTATIVQDDARFYKIVPQYDGSESEGVALHWHSIEARGYGDPSLPHGYFVKGFGLSGEQIAGNSGGVGGVIFSLPGIDIAPVDNPDGLLLRVVMDLLLDPRMNPFESSRDFSKSQPQKDWEYKWNKRGNFLYVPVSLKFKPHGSIDVYYWTNIDEVEKDPNKGTWHLRSTLGKWEKVDILAGKQRDWGYLAYYDPTDRKSKSGVLGWKKNRPAINPQTINMSTLLEKCDDGQYIPYPCFGTSGGELSIEVRLGWLLMPDNVKIDPTVISNPYGLWNGKFNWTLCQIPSVEIINNAQFGTEINTDDIEYEAEINIDAKEDIEIDTICGTSAGGVPTARGAYFITETGRQVTQLTRAGRTTQVEDLLIGTLFSQFGSRRTKLSGEMVIATHPLRKYVERNQQGKKFLLVEDSQDLMSDVSDGVITELRPDEYERF